MSNELLRIIAAGSVDDGKSTLIGRLLYDSKQLLHDQLAAVKAASVNRGKNDIDLSFVTDGLKEEREKGITIDVAYRYFATAKRRFILADCPGHFEFTRNMITGASTANVALILVDASRGITQQTLRHLYLAQLVGIHSVFICINKMDLVSYNHALFLGLCQHISDLSLAKPSTSLHFIPISALKGDNIVNASQEMPWYTQGALLPRLEALHMPMEKKQARLVTQYYDGANEIGFGHASQDFDLSTAAVFPAVSSNLSFELLLKTGPSWSYKIRGLETNKTIDLRNRIIAPLNSAPRQGLILQVQLCWLSHIDYKPGDLLHIQLYTAQALVESLEISSTIDLNTFKANASTNLSTNSIANVVLTLGHEVAYDRFEENKATGCFILIDHKHATVAAGIVI